MDTESATVETPAVDTAKSESETLAVTAPVETPAVDATKSEKPETVSYAVYEKKFKEAERLARRAAELEGSVKERESKLSAYEQKEREAAEKDMTALDLFKNKFAELSDQYKKTEADLRKERSRFEVVTASKDLDLAFKNPDRVLRMIGTDIEYDKEGHPLNVRDLLEALAEEEPELVRKAAVVIAPPPAAPVQQAEGRTQQAAKTPPSVGSANNTNRDATPRPQTVAQMEALLKGRSAEDVYQMMMDENGPVTHFLKQQR